MDSLTDSNVIPIVEDAASDGGILAPDSLDDAVLKLAAQAAFLQAFAENVIEEERPVEEVAPQRSGGEIDFGWRAGLSW